MDSLEQKKNLSDLLNRDFVKWRAWYKRLDTGLLVILLCLIVFVGSAFLDNHLLTDRGIGGLEYHDFHELLAINPDTVAWLTLDGTHIDHPVVQGEDNFEYLDRAFTGDYYAGGTLFLDFRSSRDLSDKYSIIHGHHMAGGAMFGDLEKYLDRRFFTEHYNGTLLTPTYDYDLRIIAAGEFDAYDQAIYTVGNEIPFGKIKKKTCFRRTYEIDDAKQILALSTCSSDMTDNRIVVFCKMMNKRAHE